MELLTLADVKAYYRTPSGQIVRAVDGVTLSINEGEVLGIAGESGCGKTTLAQVLALNMQPPLYLAGGEVLADGVDVQKLPPEVKRREYRGKYISVVPQGAMSALNPSLRIRQFVADLMREHYSDLTKRDALDRAEQRLRALDLPVRVLDAYPHQLSGGMKQRTVIAISTLLDPKVLICDEPTSALDVSSQRSVLELLRWLMKEKIIRSCVFVTHELPLLYQIADRVAVMYAGRIAEVGGAEEIIFRPQHPYSTALVGAVLVPEKGMKERRVEGIPGAPPDLRTPPTGCRFAARCRFVDEQCKADPVERTSGTRQVWCWKPGASA